MHLYIARHAWAYEFGDPRWPDDSLRPLENEGMDRYLQMIQALAKRGFAPEVIATSPYVRCKQTAEIISRYTEHQPEVVALDALLPGSDFDSLCQWSQQTGCDQICWVGHAPDVGDMTAALVGDKHANTRFAKGAIAAVWIGPELGFDSGELYWLATAKSLGL
jgi:phosphohistidine phosphatase